MGRHAAGPDVLHVSFSQVSTYLACPEKFHQAYVRGRAPSHRSGSLVFGSAVHEALAWYHESLMAADKRPPLAALLEAFDRTFRACSGGATPILWEDDGGPEAMAQKAHQLLTLYYDTCSPHRVLAVEKGFVFQRVATGVSGVEEEALTGVVDLIEEDADGGVFVTELKTAARRFDDVRLRFDHQMSIYSAARKVLGFPDAKLRFRVLLKTKKPAIETYEVQRDEAQVAETAVVVSQVLRAIDGAIFFPVRSWQCTNCAYRLACGT